MARSSDGISGPAFASSLLDEQRPAYEGDVLLIADEPRAPTPAYSLQGLQKNPAAPVSRAEPLDMETVVRKLIAFLTEEPLP
jgi:hypothetical protein